MDLLRTTVLIAATMADGLIAGLLFAWACSVMPGLGHTDDRTFVYAFRAMDRAILNPWFATTFIGALVLPGLAVLLHLGPEHRPTLFWTLAALAMAVATVVITRAVHLPLNAMIQAAGAPDPTEAPDPAETPDAGDPPDRGTTLAAVRERFEATWVRWNIVRTLTSTGAFICLVLAVRGS